MKTSEQNWRQLSSFQIGSVICFPVIMVGQMLSQTYGFLSAILSIFIGNAILLFLGIMASKMSFEKRKTAPENALEYFGNIGVRIFACTMALSLAGWFAIQVNMMCLGLVDLLKLDMSTKGMSILLNIILGLSITIVPLYGMRALTSFADICVPVLIATLVYALFTMDTTFQPQASHLSLRGISLVVAVLISGVINLPTFFRHARTGKDGIISSFIIFGCALPLVEIAGVYLSQTNGTILDAMTGDRGLWWKYWVALFFAFSCWATNNLNLYAGSICLESLIKTTSERLRVIFFATIGIFLSCFQLLDHFVIILDVIGICFSSMGAVILTRYIVAQFNGPKVTIEDWRIHWLAWTLGMALGYLSLVGISLTGIPVIDATMGASLGTCLILIPKFYENALIGLFR